MKKFFIVIIAAALLLTSTASADADITVWIGKLSGEDLLIEGTVAYGAAVGFSFARYFGAEVVFDYIPNSELPFNLEEFEDLLGVDVRVDLYAISGNLLLQYPVMDTVTPYFTIGYGVVGANAKADIGGQTPEAWGAAPATNWGFGAKFSVAPWIAIRGDMRWYNLNLSVDDDIGDLLPTAVENPTLSRMSVGVAFTF
ncbi:MAG TPA: outer membrane beta-barrel protein [Acidobacteriota bacterium]|nr:outer membrane beta-barrel protein [Acidobacteriota bacterium]